MKNILARKVYSSGRTYYGDFTYPLIVGETVEAPDWNAEKKCGGGLHGLLDFKGDWNLLDGSLWLVITDLEGLVVIDDRKAKIRKGKIDYVGNERGLYKRYKEYLESLSDEEAWEWVHYNGNPWRLPWRLLVGAIKRSVKARFSIG